MEDLRFSAMTVPAYFDEDTVYDSELVEFSLFDVRGEEGEIFYVVTMHGQTEFIAACYKESVRPVRCKDEKLHKLKDILDSSD